MKRNTRVWAYLTAIVMAFFAVFAFGQAAQATEKPFEPYNVKMSWYKVGGTLADTFPQDTNVITCGGIRQDDEYYIDTVELDAEYKAFIAAGKLPSPAEDQKFHPHNYTITLLPDCEVIPTPTASPTASPTPSASPTPTAQPTAQPTQSPVPSASPSAAPTKPATATTTGVKAPVNSDAPTETTTPVAVVADGSQLAFTGFNSVPWFIAAFLLLGGGVALAVVASRKKAKLHE